VLFGGVTSRRPAWDDAPAVYRVLRFIGRQLRDQPLLVIARLAAALALTAP
jgi:hypothetical protein